MQAFIKSENLHNDFLNNDFTPGEENLEKNI